METDSIETEKLASGDLESRLKALEKIKKLADDRIIELPRTTRFANNHIHTFYSFSPYSPSMAVYLAWKSGLCAAGIVDHDSVSGASEFIDAGKLLGLPTTVGCECRVNMSGTKLKGRRINDPDQLSIAYTAMHAIPRQKLGMIDDFFRPRRSLRNERNAKMCERLTSITKPLGIRIDFETDVLPLSHADEGGTITERHILLAFVKKLLDISKSPSNAADMLSDKLGVILPENLRLRLKKTGGFPEYDLLGALKAGFVERFYIPAESECPSVGEFLELCRAVGAIPAYAYLGDIPNGANGDKKPQLYEDSYLDELMQELKRLGFEAVTYMPSRNSPSQLDRISALCRKYRFLEIGGEDVNSPRQPFLNHDIDEKILEKLTESTMMLIGRTK